jgi:hypothetical protein
MKRWLFPRGSSSLPRCPRAVPKSSASARQAVGFGAASYRVTTATRRAVAHVAARLGEGIPQSECLWDTRAPLCRIPQSCILWDTMTALIFPHEKAPNLLFAELEATATERREAFLGTPGKRIQLLLGRLNDYGREKTAKFTISYTSRSSSGSRRAQGIVRILAVASNARTAHCSHTAQRGQGGEPGRSIPA